MNSLAISPLLRRGDTEAGHQPDLPVVAQFSHKEPPEVKCFRPFLLKCSLEQGSCQGRTDE